MDIDALGYCKMCGASVTASTGCLCCSRRLYTRYATTRENDGWVRLMYVPHTPRVERSEIEIKGESP